MRTIELASITYHNFKGIDDFTLDASDDIVEVMGKNAVGKTTLFDGFSWLLFGKNSEEATKFNAKPLSVNGNEILGLEPEVEAKLSVDGTPVVLRRKLAEVWSKPRGQMEKERKSDKTELYVDEVPYKLKDYQAYVDGLIDEQTFKLLTNPFAFNNLKWQDRRELLTQLVDDVDDESIISETEHPEELKKLLSDHTADERRKIVNSQKKQVKKDIDGLPARIDEAKRAIPELSGTSQKALTGMLKDYEKAADNARVAVKLLQSPTDNTAARERKAELQTQLSDQQSAYLQKQNTELSDLRNSVEEQQAMLNQHRSKLNELNTSVAQLTQAVEQEKQVHSDLLTKYHEVVAVAFDDTTLKCPTCGQTYPAETQDELRSHFNIEHSNQIEKIKEQGTECAKSLKEHQAELEQKSAEQASEQAAFTRIQTDTDQANAAYNEHKGQQQKFEETIEYKDLQKQIAECQVQIDGNSSDNSKATEAEQAKLSKINAGIQEVRTELSKLETKTTQEKRITELEAEDKRLKDQYAQLEKQSFMLDEYVRTRVSVLEDRINEKFDLVTFKLFETQKNGELNDVCEALVGGVPYSTDLNNASRINAGLDIINTLSEHYQVTAPIFVDNAESINDIIDTEAQQIRLIVSEDEKLTTKVGVK